MFLWLTWWYTNFDTIKMHVNATTIKTTISCIYHHISIFTDVPYSVNVPYNAEFTQYYTPQVITVFVTAAPSISSQGSFTAARVSHMTERNICGILLEYEWILIFLKCFWISMESMEYHLVLKGYLRDMDQFTGI